MLKSSKWLYKASSEIRQLEQMRRMKKNPLNQHSLQLCFLFLAFMGKTCCSAREDKTSKVFSKKVRGKVMLGDFIVLFR